MKLEQLRTNLLSRTYQGQIEFFTSYREARQKDLSVIISKERIKEASKGAAKKGKQITVSSTQLEMLKKLGLI